MEPQDLNWIFFGRVCPQRTLSPVLFWGGDKKWSNKVIFKLAAQLKHTGGGGRRGWWGGARGDLTTWWVDRARARVLCLHAHNVCMYSYSLMYDNNISRYNTPTWVSCTRYLAAKNFPIIRKHLICEWMTSYDENHNDPCNRVVVSGVVVWPSRDLPGTIKELDRRHYHRSLWDARGGLQAAC